MVGKVQSHNFFNHYFLSEFGKFCDFTHYTVINLKSKGKQLPQIQRKTDSSKKTWDMRTLPYL